MQTKYSIDISYFLASITYPDELDEVIRGITGNRPDCHWYASDIGPRNEINAPKYVSHGYIVDNADTLCDIIRIVGETPKIWIAFCTRTANNNGVSDHVHLYYSTIALSNVIKQYADDYRQRIKTFVGADLEIFNKCILSAMTKT